MKRLRALSGMSKWGLRIEDVMEGRDYSSTFDILIYPITGMIQRRKERPD